jgi:hypothetical protein
MGFAKLTRRVLPALIGALACSVSALPQAYSDTPAATRSESGMVVYVDPQTGVVRSEPAPGTVPLQLTPQERNALSTSHEGLVEVPLPGGGHKLDLQGRFQSPLIGTMGPDGKLRIQHLGEPK